MFHSLWKNFTISKPPLSVRHSSCNGTFIISPISPLFPSFLVSVALSTCTTHVGLVIARGMYFPPLACSLLPYSHTLWRVNAQRTLNPSEKPRQPDRTGENHIQFILFSSKICCWLVLNERLIGVRRTRSIQIKSHVLCNLPLS
jgi:hypothetical protein